jgi:hypothetical protein
MSVILLIFNELTSMEWEFRFGFLGSFFIIVCNLFGLVLFTDSFLFLYVDNFF